MPEITTDAEAVAWLASMECRECGGSGTICTPPIMPYDYCPICKDASGKSTGRRFPGLSRECPCQPNPWTNHGCEVDCIPGRHAVECDCQGSGQVPVSIPEAVAILWPWFIREHCDGYICNSVRVNAVDYGESIGWRYYVAWSNNQPAECGRTFLEALARAIAAEGE